MKYNPRTGQYKNSTGTNTIEAVPGGMIAKSYGWWQYVAPSSDPNYLFFNTYRYSNTTARHQYNTRRVLEEELGYRLIEVETSASMTIEDWKDDAVRCLLLEAAKLRLEAKKPRTQKAKNAERLAEAENLENRARALRAMSVGNGREAVRVQA